jgi:hypothetical protein
LGIANLRSRQAIAPGHKLRHQPFCISVVDPIQARLCSKGNWNAESQLFLFSSKTPWRKSSLGIAVIRRSIACLERSGGSAQADLFALDRGRGWPALARGGDDNPAPGTRCGKSKFYPHQSVIAACRPMAIDRESGFTSPDPCALIHALGARMTPIQHRSDCQWQRTRQLTRATRLTKKS